ncbi:hypothetical protein GQ53DRAFT_846149 [Thozetella sp. PMI_491]|nr:hypothetical protein GQ53DRAFT_846149 [Thozetella sp. PMI_491]
MSALVAGRSFSHAPAIRAQALSLTPATRRSAFSTSPSLLHSQPQNPDIPQFSFKDISSNPRTRFWLRATFVVLACVEGATWYNIWPKITGRGAEEPTSS